jgi:hypothetical protein
LHCIISNAEEKTSSDNLKAMSSTVLWFCILMQLIETNWFYSVQDGKMYQLQ